MAKRTSKSSLMRGLSFFLGICLLFILIIDLGNIVSLMDSLNDLSYANNMIQSTVSLDTATEVMFAIMKIIAQMIAEICGIIMSFYYTITD